MTVVFDGGSSYDPDGQIVSYVWDFGDGDNSTEPNPIHTYNDAGTYTATLTVTDIDDATDSTTTQIQVTTAVNQQPTASFTASPTSGYAPLSVVRP